MVDGDGGCHRTADPVTVPKRRSLAHGEALPSSAHILAVNPAERPLLVASPYTRRYSIYIGTTSTLYCRRAIIILIVHRRPLFFDGTAVHCAVIPAYTAVASCFFQDRRFCGLQRGADKKAGGGSRARRED